MKSLRTFLIALAVLILPGAALADDTAAAQAFIKREHTAIESLLRQSSSSARDAQITAKLDTFVDYDEVTRRAFGQPCHPSLGKCQNHWGELNAAQKAEVRGLLKQLVEKNYRKNLKKTLDYQITYRGARPSRTGDAKIRTSAKSKKKPRDPAVQVDYMVRKTGGKYQVVDIVTEGSSLTKNYYRQFHKMLIDPNKGYPHVVKKLKKKIQKT